MQNAPSKLAEFLASIQATSVPGVLGWKKYFTWISLRTPAVPFTRSWLRRERATHMDGRTAVQTTRYLDIGNVRSTSDRRIHKRKTEIRQRSRANTAAVEPHNSTCVSWIQLSTFDQWRGGRWNDRLAGCAVFLRTREKIFLPSSFLKDPAPCCKPNPLSVRDLL